MFDSIPEWDWKKIRDLKPVLLDRFCQRILREIDHKAAEVTLSHHQRYLDIWEIMRNQDRELAKMFNGLRRSVAILCIWHTRRLALMTDEEFS
ncbi:MAG: hypothetical protein JWM91_2198 [Rhodospirillales bacterium]|nr:hypothetical protein [Rhodospirillales bacterium]